MLIGTRNWYTDFGVTPTVSFVGTGVAFGQQNLAQPWRGAIFRRAGTSVVGGDSVSLSVTWPRVVPVCLVGVVGYMTPAEISQTITFTLRNGGPGGAVVASESIDFFVPAHHLNERINLFTHFPAQVLGDYLSVVVTESAGALDAWFECLGMWASSAFTANGESLVPEIVNDSIVETAIDGSERSIDGFIRNNLTIDFMTDAGVVSPYNSDDSIDSVAELIAFAGTTKPVAVMRSPAASMSLDSFDRQSIHGLLRPGSGFTKAAGPNYRVRLAIEEL